MLHIMYTNSLFTNQINVNYWSSNDCNACDEQESENVIWNDEAVDEVESSGVVVEVNVAGTLVVIEASDAQVCAEEDCGEVAVV